MPVVQCPHCVQDVELEDGSFGLFECPYCDEEFEFELEYEPKYKSFNDLITDDLIPKSNSNLPLKLGICLFFGSALIILFGILSISNTSDDYDNTSTTCKSHYGLIIGMKIEAVQQREIMGQGLLVAVY